MGEWITPNWRVLLADVISSPRFGISSDKQFELIAALRETGFLLDGSYYVPDLPELLSQCRQLDELTYRGGDRHRVRWVMCREIQLALIDRYRNYKAPRTTRLTAWLDDPTGPIDSAMDDLMLIWEARVAHSVESAMDAGLLFGVPIRRDPAARQIMWEFIPEAERGRD